MSEGLRRQPLKVPVHVLGNVHRQIGTGWRWSCNFKGCNDYGVRITMEDGWMAVVKHWCDSHRATGGQLK